MGEHRRKADGRRVFSTEFKRTTVQRILTSDKTLAALPRVRYLAKRDSQLEAIRRGGSGRGSPGQ
jgi:transposase-like protein